MRYAKKRDACERSIITALEREGIVVQQLDGSGVPDLLCLTPFGVRLLECKDAAPGKKAHKRSDGTQTELTPAQVRFWERWRAREGVDLFIVHNAIEALIACGLTP